MINCRCCHNCEERHQNCHSDCDEYKSFRASKDAENAKIREEKHREELVTAYVVGEIEKKKKKRKGKL